MTYDCAIDTKKHIARVQELARELMRDLESRVAVHDLTKLLSPEKEIFDEMTPRLKESTYGSDEYQGFLKTMKTALDHHYACNRHHPEHFENGVNDMTLVDILEMFCDWKAASERHQDSDMYRSIDISAERFGLSPQLISVMKNTVKYFGWEK